MVSDADERKYVGYFIEYKINKREIDNMGRFEKYMSLKRFGTDEVDGIEFGECYIFPKIDGTNASCWIENGEIFAGSRNRLLNETSKGDNAGFCKWVKNQDNIKSLLKNYPHLRLFGEWLVPHSLKTYRDECWKRFYIFDVYNHATNKFMRFEEYSMLLDEFNVDYIPVLWKIKNPTIDKLLDLLPKNQYLIKDGCGSGEGLVIKNYNFENKYGRVTWAKLITNEFREKHVKEMGCANIETQKTVEELITDKYFTESFIEKEYNKILLQLENKGLKWSSKNIPELLGRLWSEFVKEESYNFIKQFKNPKIDFKVLQRLCTIKIKNTLSELF